MESRYFLNPWKPAGIILKFPCLKLRNQQKASTKFGLMIEKVEKGQVQRKPYKLITPAEYADTKMGTAHSRWMIAPGPWMPFSMVKLSPDNQNAGWQAGYDPIFESIGGFSHIHEWTMAGLLLMPTNGPLKTQVGDQRHPDEGYRSRINPADGRGVHRLLQSRTDGLQYYGRTYFYHPLRISAVHFPERPG